MYIKHKRVPPVLKPEMKFKAFRKVIKNILDLFQVNIFPDLILLGKNLHYAEDFILGSITTLILHKTISYASSPL